VYAVGVGVDTFITSISWPEEKVIEIGLPPELKSMTRKNSSQPLEPFVDMVSAKSGVRREDPMHLSAIARLSFLIQQKSPFLFSGRSLLEWRVSSVPKF